MRPYRSVITAGPSPQLLPESVASLGFEDSIPHAAGHGGRDSESPSAKPFLELPPKPAQGDLLVARLASFLLADHDDSGWAVAEPNGCLAAVDVLSAGAAGAIGLDVALGE